MLNPNTGAEASLTKLLNNIDKVLNQRAIKFIDNKNDKQDKAILRKGMYGASPDELENPVEGQVFFGVL